MCIDKVFKIYVMESFIDARCRPRYRPRRTEYSRYRGEKPSSRKPPPKHQYQSAHYPYPSQSRQHVTLERHEGVPVLDGRHTSVISHSTGDRLHNVSTLRGGNTRSRSRHSETREFGTPSRIDRADIAKHFPEGECFSMPCLIYNKGPNPTQGQPTCFEAQGAIPWIRSDNTIRPANRHNFIELDQCISDQVEQLEEDRLAKSNSRYESGLSDTREHFRGRLEVLGVAPNSWNSSHEHRAQNVRPLEPYPYRADLACERELSPGFDIPRLNPNLCTADASFERRMVEERSQTKHELENPKNPQFAVWQDAEPEYRQLLDCEARQRSEDLVAHTSPGQIINLAAQRALVNDQCQSIHAQARTQTRSHPQPRAQSHRHLKPLFAIRNFLSWNHFHPFQNNLDMLQAAEILSQATAFTRHQATLPHEVPVNDTPAIASPSMQAEYTHLVEELAINRSMQQEDAYIIADAMFHPHEIRLHATHELAQLRAQEQSLVGVIDELELEMQAELAVPFIDVTIHHPGLACEENENTIRDEERIVELDMEELSLEGEDDEEERRGKEKYEKMEKGGRGKWDTERLVGTIYEVDDDGERIIEKKAKMPLLEDEKGKKGKKGNANVRVL